MPVDPASHIQVFQVDLPFERAAALIDDPDALKDALGVVPPRDRLYLFDPSALAGIGLSSYLVEGEGARVSSVSPDATRLDAVRGPVLLLLPRATTLAEPATSRAPLVHLGDYPLEAAAPAAAPLTTPTAEGIISGVPPRTAPATNNRRASGIVAMVALAVALLVAFVMWLVAS